MIDFQTPAWVCDYMVTLIPANTVTILEPTPGEGNLLRVLSAYDTTAPKDFWRTDGRWDCIVMNPPFSPMSGGYAILFHCMNMSDNIVALMPWLTLINSEMRTSAIFKFGLVSVTHLPRVAFPGSRVQCAILQMSKGFIGTTKLIHLPRPSTEVPLQN